MIKSLRAPRGTSPVPRAFRRIARIVLPRFSFDRRAKQHARSRRTRFAWPFPRRDVATKRERANPPQRPRRLLRRPRRRLVPAALATHTIPMPPSAIALHYNARPIFERKLLFVPRPTFSFKTHVDALPVASRPPVL